MRQANEISVSNHTDHDWVPSRLQLPAGSWPTVIACLCDHFQHIEPSVWHQRFLAERVRDEGGGALTLTAPYRVGMEITYFRDVPNETPIPLQEKILHSDAHLMVVDKPHFLPVVPAGKYVRESLLFRLREQTGNADLVALHRIDRHTAGLVLFSLQPATRDHYQRLFRERRIDKTYQARASALPQLQFPHVHRSRIMKGEPFFRMQEVAGVANSETHIDVIDTQGPIWQYQLQPITGRQHQLRVHLAALGAPILNDPYYPELRAQAPDDFEQPLQLLASALAFEDPVSGQKRQFKSTLALHPLPQQLRR